jgi:hypothetical protein
MTAFRKPPSDFAGVRFNAAAAKEIFCKKKMYFHICLCREQAI